MIIDLRQNTNNEYEYIKSTAVKLIAFFGYLRPNEIYKFFPSISNAKIKKCLEEAVGSKLIIKVSDYHRSYFYGTPLMSKKPGFGFKRREQMYEIGLFIQYLLNAVDQEGYLINTINCIGYGVFPFDAFFECNGTCYDIMHCKRNNIMLYSQLLNESDKKLDKVETNFKRTQSPETPYTITEEPERIVIVDSEEELDYIHFRKVKYIACRKGKDYLLKAGD